LLSNLLHLLGLFFMFLGQLIPDDPSDSSVETMAGQMAHGTVEVVGMGLATASSFGPLRPVGIHGCEKR